tara:strand:- start:7718 stop:9040 length:1323 start_codon:yes stop_codon:yes gene_type:complete
METINKKKSIDIYCYFLIFLCIFSFFLGFYFDENSAGAGTYTGDWVHIWKNIQTFANNDLLTALKYTDSSESSIYQSSRTPLIYVLNKLFNPFLYDPIVYRRSIFAISLTTPIIFYFCLKQKFRENYNSLFLLAAFIPLLSPYYRTTAFWGLEENYGIIFMLLTFLVYNIFMESEHQSDKKNYAQLFLISFFSSCCLYFDQKLIIIPLICFFSIIFSKKIFKLKIYFSFLYFLFSLPYIYMIFLWGALLPEGDMIKRGIGTQLYFGHIGYATTIIAFYLLPFLFFRGKKITDQLIDFFSEKINYFFIIIFIFYLVYLLIFYNFNDIILGKGFIHKISIVFFDNENLRKIFTYFSFFISWIIILLFINKKLKNYLIILFFFILSVVIRPILQEYFDPLIVILAFTFLSGQIYINAKNLTILYLYLTVLLISSNIYYFNLLN